MEIFSALLAICAGNSPVPGEFPLQRPVTRSFDVFFDLRLNNRLSKQLWDWWLETQSHPLWRHCNVLWDFVSHFIWWSLILKTFIKSVMTYNTSKILSVYREIIWESWRVKSTTTRLFQEFVQVNIKENINALYYWPYVSGDRWYSAQRVSIA